MAFFGFMKGPQNIALRPLDKGIVLNVAPQDVEAGGFVDLNNIIATQGGLRRRSGYTAYASDETFDGLPLGITTVFDEDGTQWVLLLTTKWVYHVTSAGYTKIPWIYDTGTITTTGSSSVVTGTATAWDVTEIEPGSEIEIDGVFYEIETVDSTTQITVVGTPAAVTGAAYDIHRALNVPEPYTGSTVAFEGLVLYALKKWPLLFINTRTATVVLDEWVSHDPSTGVFHPGNVVYFRDRVFVANLTDGTDDEQPQRLRWSLITAPQRFDDVQAWLDVPYLSGRINGLHPLGQGLMIYFEDGIYVASPTNIPGLPISVQALDTGGIGLVGQRAVTTVTDGHFFVGQDNIYFLGNQGIVPVGTPVVQRTIRECERPWRIMAATDPRRSRVVFGFPKSDDIIEEIWSFEYLAGAWSREDMQTYLVTAPLELTASTWSDLSFTWESAEMAGQTWSDFGTASNPQRSLFVEHEQTLWRWSASGESTDADGSPISVRVESPDFDLDMPDEVKTWTRLSVRLRPVRSDLVRTDPLVFQLRTSNNGGRDWRVVGNLRIPVNKDEGWLNFRLTSSTFRFELTSSDVVPSYLLHEIVMQVVARGQELVTATQRSSVAV